MPAPPHRLHLNRFARVGMAHQQGTYDILQEPTSYAIAPSDPFAI